jgi:hypothetical protein
VIAPNGRIYFGANGDDSGGRFYVLTDGGASATKVAEFTTGGTMQSSPAVGPDGSVYVGCDDNNLYAFDVDGGLKWRFATGGPVVSAPAVGGDGLLYFGSRDGRIYAARDMGSSAAQVWSYRTGGEVQSSPAIGADGSLYAASFDGSVYAFQDAAVPSFRGTISDPSPRPAGLGSTVSYTVSLQALSGFSGTVSLAVAGTLPDGVTATFEPATVDLTTNNTGRATLRLATTTASPAGEFRFRVRATAGSVARETNRTSLVLADNSFMLDGQPALQRVTAGQSTMFSVLTLPNPINGTFKGTVALTAAILSGPTGGTPPTFAFDTISATIPALSTLAATTTTGTLPGPYVIEVRGTSGAITRTAQLRLEVGAAN